MLGEAVVFGVTGGVLVYEYHRTKEAERQRQEDAQEVRPKRERRSIIEVDL